MKYVAILETEKELSEESIEDLKNTVFVGDEQNSYCFDILSIKKAPKQMKISLHGEYGYRDTQTTKYIKEGYNQALKDCGVIEE